MTNSMKRVIMERRRSLKHQAEEEKSEDEILDTIFKTFDKLHDDEVFYYITRHLQKLINNMNSDYDVLPICGYDMQADIEEEVNDVIVDDGDEVIAEVCKELGVEVAIPYYGKLYDHACLRYIGKVI